LVDALVAAVAVLLELLLLLLAELLLNLLGLQLLPVRILVLLLLLLGPLLLSLLSFLPPVPPSCVFCHSCPKAMAGCLLLCVQPMDDWCRRINELVAFAHFKNQSGLCVSSGLLVKCQDAWQPSLNRDKAERCLDPLSSLLNHQAGGDLHIQLPQHGLSAVSLGLLSRRN
jgi:hypothetical protein